MNICGTATPWAKIAFLVMIVALALHIAGFATQYWLQTETIQENVVFSHGLWKANNCSGGHDSPCDEMSIPDDYDTDSLKAMKGMQSIVLILLVVATVVMGFYVASERFREMSVAVFVVVIIFITVTIGIIAMIVWLAQLSTNHYPGYSFGLVVFAFLLAFLSGVLMIPDIRKYNNRKRPDVMRVVPDTRDEPRRPAKYDQMKYDQTYNRKFAPTPEKNVRHYYNPNREPYVRSPPPAYKTMADSDYKDYKGYKDYKDYRSYGRQSLTRTEVYTPDIHLGRDTRRPRRY